MNKPHKHAEVIKAWADGVEIEYRDPPDEQWSDAPCPNWYTSLEYRVKPQPKKYKVDVWLTFKKKDGVFITSWSREPPSYIIPDEIVIHHTLEGELPNV